MRGVERQKLAEVKQRKEFVVDFVAPVVAKAVIGAVACLALVWVVEHR